MHFDLVALSAMGFQTLLKLNYLHEQGQKVEMGEKQGRPPSSITCQGDNAVLRSSQCLTHRALSLGSEQRHAYLLHRYFCLFPYPASYEVLVH